MIEELSVILQFIKKKKENNKLEIQNSKLIQITVTNIFLWQFY